MTELRLVKRLGLMVEVTDLEMEQVRLEVYISGEWRETELSLPHDEVVGLREGRIDKIAGDDSEEVAARILES
jgi:hypothetical protein